MLWIEGNLYRLGNGNVIRVYNMCDDKEFQYGYDYFDGKTLRMIDGGVFNVSGDDVDAETVLREALGWCSLDPDETEWTLLMENVEYSELENLGYSGF